MKQMIVLHCQLLEFALVIEETASLKSNLTASSLCYIMTEVTFKQCADRNNNSMHGLINILSLKTVQQTDLENPLSTEPSGSTTTILQNILRLCSLVCFYIQ